MPDEQKTLDLALERYPIAVDGWRSIYTKAENDMEFVYDLGAGQWPTKMRKDRESADRPVLTINKLQKFVRQLRGEALLNKPRMHVIPVDDKADVEVAKIYDGLIRQIEYLSDASSAYDTAYMNAVSCSVGFFRIISKFENDHSFNSNLEIDRIINPFSVHYDPAAKKFEYEDANYCFIDELVDLKTFKRKWPEADASCFDGSSTAEFGDWMHGEQIRIAEYFWKEPVSKTIVQLETGEVLELNKEVTPEYIHSNGGIIVKDRKVKTHKTKWCKISGNEILETEDWPGKHIPIIPILGDELVVNGKRHYLSHLRGAKGAQQMYNYWATAATENVALSPKMPYIVDHRQVAGFENEWDNANTTNQMYIRYNAVAGVKKPHRESQSDIPSAIMTMMGVTAADIEDHIGRYEASKGQTSNERSGKAIHARINQADKGSYVFVDNFKKGMTFGCRQLVDLIPKIYDTQRALRVRGEEGKEQIINVNTPYLDESGQPQLANDLSIGEYDLVATIGASFGSKRQEMVAMMIEAMQYAPQVAMVIAPLIFKYSDFPGSDEIYQELKKEVEALKQQPQTKPGKPAM